MSDTITEENKLTKKDFVTANDVRWCPGCGDYAILNALQRTLPEIGVPREKFTIVSGIGCSSRFPYYMETYGFHTIHGRAPAVATGIKTANPDLSVWMITGDGDGLSIGGNHLLHLLRRNPNINILLFNNRIYGLTKGQYSPTSEIGKVTKSTPMGSIDQPVNPIRFALTAGATFIARTVDNNVKHMVETFKAAHEHRGVSFIEIFQNCVIFNDKAFDEVYGKANRADQALFLEEGKPLIFGQDKNRGIRLKSLSPEVVTLGEEGVTEEDLLVHETTRPRSTYAHFLANMNFPNQPTPIGIFYRAEQPTYEDLLTQQLNDAKATQGPGDLQQLIQGSNAWHT